MILWMMEKLPHKLILRFYEIKGQLSLINRPRGRALAILEKLQVLCQPLGGDLSYKIRRQMSKQVT